MLLNHYFLTDALFHFFSHSFSTRQTSPILKAAPSLRLERSASFKSNFISQHNHQQRTNYSLLLQSNANAADTPIDASFENNNVNKGNNNVNKNDEVTPKQPKNQQTIEPKNTSKAFNATFLLLCFGFAAYSILNVDEGMTRGWSMAEKAMRIPLDNWSSYESSLNQQPVFTKTTINVVIYLLGDWLSQTLFIKRNLLEFDAWRTLRNGFIGMVFGPLVHEYYEFSDYILPVDAAMINRVYKILMDQTIYIFVKCSVYIVAVNMLAGESWEFSRDEARRKIKNIMFTAWKFWPLVHCVTYGAIPARHRILWVNCVDLFWNAILASLASGKADEEDSDGTAVIIDEGATANNSTKATLVTAVERIDDNSLLSSTSNINKNGSTSQCDDKIETPSEHFEDEVMTKDANKQKTWHLPIGSEDDKTLNEQDMKGHFSGRNESTGSGYLFEATVDEPGDIPNPSILEIATNTSLAEA